MDVTMTQLSDDTPNYEPPKDDRSFGPPIQQNREPPKDDRSFGSPVPVYYDEPSPMYYNPPPRPSSPETVQHNEFNIDKQTMILVLAAFVVGILLGSLRRPIILKH